MPYVWESQQAFNPMPTLSPYPKKRSRMDDGPYLVPKCANTFVDTALDIGANGAKANYCKDMLLQIEEDQESTVCHALCKSYKQHFDFIYIILITVFPSWRDFLNDVRYGAR